MTLRAAVAMLGALVLAGCVAFERPPVATLGCDQRLAGTWQPARENSGVTVDVDATCQAHFPPRDSGRLPSYRTVVRTFELEGHDYAVFTPDDIEQVLGLEAGSFAAVAPKDSVVLLRYRIDGDRLRATVVDANFVMKAIADGRIRGREASRMVFVVAGDTPAMAALLREQPALFNETRADSTMQLRRQTAGAAP